VAGSKALTPFGFTIFVFFVFFVVDPVVG